MAGSPAAGSKPSLLLLLAIVALTAGGANGATTFRVINMCPFPVWPAAIPTGGGTQLNSGETWLVMNVPSGTKSGRIWGRTGCQFAAGHGRCATGDCNGVLRCELSGKPPATLAKFTLGGGSGGAQDFYDISVADGYNLPMDFFCGARAGETPIRCRDAGCPDGNHGAGEGKVRMCRDCSQYDVVFCPNP